MSGTTHQTTGPCSVSLDDLYTIEKLVEANPEVLSLNLIRWQIRHRHETGLDKCCIRSGKRVLISKSRYEQWLASQVGA